VVFEKQLKKHLVRTGAEKLADNMENYYKQQENKNVKK